MVAAGADSLTRLRHRILGSVTAGVRITVITTLMPGRSKSPCDDGRTTIVEEEGALRMTLTTKPPRVVIVGGGFGGMTAAKSIARLPVEITLVDRHNFHTFSPLLYQVATSGSRPTTSRPTCAGSCSATRTSTR